MRLLDHVPFGNKSKFLLSFPSLSDLVIGRWPWPGIMNKLDPFLEGIKLDAKV